MSERMTDERLAELELESLRWKYAPRCKELFAAIKAERQRVEELEHIADCTSRVALNADNRAEAAEAKLDIAQGRVYDLSSRLVEVNYDIIPELQLSLKAAEAKVEALEEWIEQEGERGDICTFNILRKVCSHCQCKRNKEQTK